MKILIMIILILASLLLFVSYSQSAVYKLKSKNQEFVVASFHNYPKKPKHVLNLVITDPKILWLKAEDEVGQEHGQGLGNWDIFVAGIHDYGFSQKINKIKIVSPDQKIMGVAGKWNLGSKRKLWKNLVSYHGLEKALKLMPMTYSLPEDLNILIVSMKNQNQNQNLLVENKNNNGRMIILKKDIQRQKGLMLTDDWKKVKKYASDYVVAQELIPDTYLYKGYRVSLRYYLLVISHGQSKSFWIHPRGIVTYAKSRSNLGQGLEQFENMVASFYCSQNKYALGFPITLEDFYQEIGMEQGMEIWAGVRGIARMTALAVMDKIGWYQFKLENLSFELFGMDFLIDKDLKPKLIEVNVGPGMIPFGTQDAELRKKVYLDMFDKVGIQFSTMAGKGENEFRLLAFSEKK